MNDYVTDFDPQGLEMLTVPGLNKLNILGFIPLERLLEFSEFTGGLELSDTYFSESNENRLSALAECAGADSLSHVIAVFEINGNIYLLCLELIEYSGKWYISTFGGNLNAFLDLYPSMHGLIPMSVWGEDYGFDADRFLELFASM